VAGHQLFLAAIDLRRAARGDCGPRGLALGRKPAVLGERDAVKQLGDGVFGPLAGFGYDLIEGEWHGGQCWERRTGFNIRLCDLRCPESVGIIRVVSADTEQEMITEFFPQIQDSTENDASSRLGGLGCRSWHGLSSPWSGILEAIG